MHTATNIGCLNYSNIYLTPLIALSRFSAVVALSVRTFPGFPGHVQFIFAFCIFNDVGDDGELTHNYIVHLITT